MEEKVPKKESLTGRLPRAAGGCAGLEVALPTVVEERKNVIPDFGRNSRCGRGDIASTPV